jgi:hypothetical protein
MVRNPVWRFGGIAATRSKAEAMGDGKSILQVDGVRPPTDFVSQCLPMRLS